MGAIDLSGLPDHALLLVDSAPVIYLIEANPKWEPHFKPVFESHHAGQFRLAITTLAIAEVLTGPLGAGDEALARRYRTVLESWQPVELDTEIAEMTARLRVAYTLKLADAVQAASALKLNAAALVTHDRDISRVHGLRIIS